jgi:uncharacterized protein YdcH (DUF465 family)
MKDIFKLGSLTVQHLNCGDYIVTVNGQHQKLTDAEIQQLKKALA